MGVLLGNPDAAGTGTRSSAAHRQVSIIEPGPPLAAVLDTGTWRRSNSTVGTKNFNNSNYNSSCHCISKLFTSSCFLKTFLSSFSWNNSVQINAERWIQFYHSTTQATLWTLTGYIWEGGCRLSGIWIYNYGSFNRTPTAPDLESSTHIAKKWVMVLLTRFYTGLQPNMNPHNT